MILVFLNYEFHRLSTRIDRLIDESVVPVLQIGVDEKTVLTETVVLKFYIDSEAFFNDCSL